MMIIPKNIEFVYHGTHVEYIKDNDPNKPLTPQEKKACDEVVRQIVELSKAKRNGGNSLMAERMVRMVEVIHDIPL